MSPSRSAPSTKYRTPSEFIAGLILFFFGLLLIRESRRLPLGGIHAPGPGFFPFYLGCLVVILSLILLAGLLIGRVEVTRGQWKGLLWQKVVFASMVLFAYSLTLESIGYLAGTFLLFGILLRLIEKKNILMVLGLSVFISLGTYLLFKYWLFIQLPGGIIPF